MFFLKVPYAPWVYAALAIAVAGSGSKSLKEELWFLKPVQIRQVRQITRFLIATPFVLYLLYEGELIPALLVLTSVFWSGIGRPGRLQNIVIPTPFSKFPFEWIRGFRRTWWLLALVLFVFVKALQVQNGNLGLFTLVAFFGIALYYYLEPEHPHFVWIFTRSPSAFVRHKIMVSFWYATLLVFIPASCLTYFFSEKLPFILLIYFFGQCYLILVILAKYAVFPRTLGLASAILIALCITLPPLLLVIIPFFYRKALKQLAKVL